MSEANEVAYLVRFFAKSRDDQWRDLPASFSPRFLDIWTIECSVDTPVAMLGLILSGLLAEIPTEFQADAEIVSLLREIRVLLYRFILDHPQPNLCEGPENFRQESDEIFTIWRTLSRLCSSVSERPVFRDVSVQGLNLEYFVQKYTTGVA